MGASEPAWFRWLVRVWFAQGADVQRLLGEVVEFLALGSGSQQVADDGE